VGMDCNGKKKRQFEREKRGGLIFSISWGEIFEKGPDRPWSGGGRMGRGTSGKDLTKGVVLVEGQLVYHF